MLLMSSKIYAEDKDAFNKHVLKMNKYMTQYKMMNTKYKELVKRRTEASTPKEIKEVHNETILIHKKMDESLVKYRKIYNDLKYRYPKLGQTVMNYSYKAPSLKDVENELNLQDLLDAAKEKVTKKYKKFIDEEHLSDDRSYEIKKAKMKNKRIRLVK